MADDQRHNPSRTEFVPPLKPAEPPKKAPRAVDVTPFVVVGGRGALKRDRWINGVRAAEAHRAQKVIIRNSAPGNLHKYPGKFIADHISMSRAAVVDLNDGRKTRCPRGINKAPEKK